MTMFKYIDFIKFFITIKYEYCDRHPKTGKVRTLNFFAWRSLKGRIRLARDISKYGSIESYIFS